MKVILSRTKYHKRSKTMAITLSTVLTVLAIIAHPDDEILFGGFIHALTHHLNASVDLVCVTNGEGGFAYTGLSEPLYGNQKLSEEAIGRTHLPRIRQQELLGSGRIIDIRKFFFYDQMDLEYSLDINTVLEDQWDTEWVIKRFQHTLKHGNGADGYDLMAIILPSVDSHGHHTVSGLLALEAIDRLQQAKSTDVKIPTVIGGSEFVLYQPPSYPGNRLAEVLTNVEFRFNLRWKTIDLPMVDYQTILLWMAAEHKTQGTLIDELLNEYNRDNEQYFYFAINDQYGDNGRLSMVQNLFTQLADLHQNDRRNMLSNKYTSL
jgi:LmbE family N-acetylglucosaminyl deacetylase